MEGGGPYIKMTDAMNKQLEHIGSEKSCGACALQYLGLPKNIIDNLVKTAEGYSRKQASGLQDINMRNNIRTYENTYDESNSKLFNNSCPKTQIYLYGVELLSSAFNPIIKKVLIDNNNQYYSDKELGLKPLTNHLIDKALNKVYEIIPPGYATIIGVTWKKSLSDIIGHYTIFAKGINNNLYLIENQAIGNQGIYKNPDEIREYFKSQGDISYLITFECGKLIDSASEKWLEGRKTTHQTSNIIDYPTIERQPSLTPFQGYSIPSDELQSIFFDNNIPSNWSNTQIKYIIQYKNINVYAFNDGNHKYIFLDIDNPKILLTLNDVLKLSKKQIPEGWVNLQGGIYEGQYKQIYDANVNVLKIQLLQKAGRKNIKTKKKNEKKEKHVKIFKKTTKIMNKKVNRKSYKK